MAMNPYAAPQGPLLAPGSRPLGRFYLEGDVLVAEKGAELPPICIFSGEATPERETKNVAWTPQWVMLFLLLGALPAIVMILIFQKKGMLTYGLGKKARARRRNGILLAKLGSFGSLGLMAVGIATEQIWLIPLGFLTFLVAIIAGIVMARTYTPTKIDETSIRLKVKPAYIQALREQGYV